MTAPSARPVPTQEDVLAGYGFVGLMAKAIPELNDILSQAIKGQWTPDRFVQTVADSAWYKRTPAAEREWITKQITDPASAEQELKNGALQIQRVASELGFGALPGGDDLLRRVYLQSRLSGITDEAAKRQFIFNALARPDVTNDDPLLYGGRYGQLVSQAFQAAHDYGYQSTDLAGEILRWVHGDMAAGGTADISGWTQGMIKYAEAMYAPYKDEIRGGRTVADIAKPVTDRVAQLLEVNPANLSVNDPLIRRAMTEWSPEGRAYSLREIEDQARRDARWKTTDNAKQSAVQFLEQIGGKFGLIPGSVSGR